MPIEFYVILGALLLGIIIFLLAGIFRVKPDTAAIFEKLGEFKFLHQQGFYFHFPIFYQKVATYSTKQVTEIINFNDEKIQLVYHIIDIPKFHYSGHDIEKALATTLADNHGEMLTSRQFIDALYSIGIAIISTKE